MNFVPARDPPPLLTRGGLSGGDRHGKMEPNKKQQPHNFSLIPGERTRGGRSSFCHSFLAMGGVGGQMWNTPHTHSKNEKRKRDLQLSKNVSAEIDISKNYLTVNAVVYGTARKIIACIS